MISASSSVLPVVDSFLKRFKLTRRETEATILLVQGLRPKEITEHMSCSEKTVYAHLARVCRKTGCRDHHEVLCAMLAFACQAAVRTEPERVALPDQAPATMGPYSIPRARKSGTVHDSSLPK
jgi:DNA-binding CsgD family transcriptional regulator